MGDMVSGKNYYEVLGVPRDATEETIRTKYRTLAKTMHPDVSRAADAEQRFQELQVAFSTLSQPLARREYDSTLRQHEAKEAEPDIIDTVMSTFDLEEFEEERPKKKKKKEPKKKKSPPEHPRVGTPDVDDIPDGFLSSGGGIF